MAHITLFSIPAAGHVNPSLPVTAELVRRGVRVTYYNTPEWRERIERTGATFRAYPPIPDLERLLTSAGSTNFAYNAHLLIRQIDHLLPAVLEALRANPPDCLIYDSLAVWARAAGRLLGLRSAAFITTFALPPGVIPPLPLSVVAPTLWYLLRETPAYLRTARLLRQRHQVRDVNLMNALMNLGDLNLVFTSETLQPLRDRLDASFRFVGPALGERHDALDFALDERPLVYVSLGTINNHNVPFYRQCFAALGDLPVQVVLSAGRRTPLDALGTPPANFIVRPFVAQLEVLQRARAFVTHAGLNSVHEGLMFGVPLLLLPQQPEQSLVAAQVVRHGAGLAFGSTPPYGQIATPTLRNAVQCLLADDTFRQAAARLGDGLRTAGGAARAADEIHAFLQKESEPDC